MGVKLKTIFNIPNVYLKYLELRLTYGKKIAEIGV